MKPFQLSKDIVLSALFAIYLYVLVKVILFKLGPVELEYLIERLQHNWQHPYDIVQRFHAGGNITPFKEITRELKYSTNLLGFPPDNLLGNIEAFIPLGIMAPMIFRYLRGTWLGLFLLAFLLSASFEVTQLVLSIGTFDVDDVILNVTGALIGYTVFRLFSRRIRPISSAAVKSKEQRTPA